MELDTAVVAEGGSFIVFDSMLFRRAGVNHGEPMRRAVNHVYAIPLITQQIALPAVLGESIGMILRWPGSWDTTACLPR